jgi:hypothetical protein
MIGDVRAKRCDAYICANSGRSDQDAIDPVRTLTPTREQSAMLDKLVEFGELANVSGDLGTGFLTTAVNGRRSMVIMLP